MQCLQATLNECQVVVLIKVSTPPNGCFEWIMWIYYRIYWMETIQIYSMTTNDVTISNNNRMILFKFVSDNSVFRTMFSLSFDYISDEKRKRCSVPLKNGKRSRKTTIQFITMASILDFSNRDFWVMSGACFFQNEDFLLKSPQGLKNISIITILVEISIIDACWFLVFFPDWEDLRGKKPSPFGMRLSLSLKSSLFKIMENEREYNRCSNGK